VTARGRPFHPGASGNPGGRPKGTRRFAQKIRKATHGGAELVEFALEVMRGPDNAMKDRLRALEFLADRMIGRAPQAIGISATVEPLPPTVSWDLSKLSYNELTEFERLVGKAHPNAAVPAVPRLPR
jgi:hypothetical protein